MEDLLFEGAGTCCCLVEGPNGKLLSRLDFKQKLPPKYSRAVVYIHGFPDQARFTPNVTHYC